MEFDAIHHLVIEREDFYYKHLAHEDWTIYHVRSGSFRCTLNGREDVIAEGDVYIIPPNAPFERSTISPIRVDFIRFLPHVPQKMLFELPIGKHTPSDTARLQGTLRLMRSLPQEVGDPPSPTLQHLLTDLLLQLYLERSAPTQEKEAADPIVSRILQFFEENPLEYFDSK